ncbi:STP1 protein [Plasmodium ovale wallikeri]|uniref:STP1 protein n=1 Tax=Plasmodium ovale wallikeri TaxID=864142 RepID=A0A1A9AG15_PLAOA|nr:STP1 protein [Plasmodium ovale wallikeri]
MKKFIHTCNEIEKASKKSTVNIFIRYKTPILEGAIKVINEFLKDKNDGVHYKKLCEELPKYIRVQKKCFKHEIEKLGKTLTTGEWNIILNALLVTYTHRKINRLCYLENDKEIKKKKEVLNIHNAFRDFCIEKKRLYENTNNMDFEQCNDYMSWLSRKKMELQVLDPNYEYIKEYQVYFDIRDNCNYPWLLKDTGGITCQRLTRTKAREKDNEPKTLNSPSQSTPAVTTVSNSKEKKATPAVTVPVPKGEQDHVKAIPADTAHERGPKKIAPTVDGNSAKKNEPERIHTWLEGFSIFQPTPVFQPRPPPQPAPDPKYLQFKNLFESDNNNLSGNVIPHKYSHSTNIESIKNSKMFRSYVEGEPIKTNISKTHKFIPRELLRSQEFVQLLRLPRNRDLLRTQQLHSLLSKKPFIEPHDLSKQSPKLIPDSQQFSTIIPRAINYIPMSKSTKSRASILRKLSSFTKITSDNKEMVKMEIEPATPDASYFRSPSMIYTLVFLTIFTIISTFYLISKYTPLGLLFSKKKKKKQLKRQLEIKKILEESPSFGKITNYSVNDMPYENKTHDDNNIYTKIKIQKSIINKNISLPKKKKNKRKAIIDIHMELLNKYKNDEWELNKSDFLQICLEEFIREQNKIYSNSENTNLVMKNISIQNTKEDKMLLLDEWI